MIELRHNTSQLVIVGPVLGSRGDPISGKVLPDYLYHYFLRADWSKIDIVSRNWGSIPNAVGYYMLGLLVTDVSVMGQAEIYIYDPSDMSQPISLKCSVVSQNTWDAKYNSNLLKIEPEAQEF